MKPDSLTIFYIIIIGLLLWILYYDYIYQPVDKRKLKVKSKSKTIKRKKR